KATLKIAARGDDPRKVREQLSQDAATDRANTYEATVKDYITREQKGAKGNATAGEVQRALLREEDFKDWHSRPVSSLTAQEVWRRLELIRDGGTLNGETA